jgi:hypothetical protein
VVVLLVAVAVAVVVVAVVVGATVVPEGMMALVLCEFVVGETGMRLPLMSNTAKK